MTDIKTLRLQTRQRRLTRPFSSLGLLGALAQMPGHDSSEIEEGDLVRVAASDGRIIGTGHFQIGSIAVRMLSFDADENIDSNFYRRRIEQAAALRRALDLPRTDTDAYRLIHMARATSCPALL